MITDAEIRQQQEAVIAQAMKIGARIALNTLIVEGRPIRFERDEDDLITEISRRIEAWEPQPGDRRIP